MSVFRIGFLPRNESFVFPGCEVMAVPHYADVAEAIKKCRLPNCDPVEGFVYPERGQHLFRLPASHEIRLNDETYVTGSGREIPAFITHFLGLLHGAWLQFDDWWFDRRVPADARPPFHLTRHEASQVLETGLRTWLKWKPAIRARMTNALYMYCRSRSYDWEWERFAIDYWVTDGLWRTAKQLGRVCEVKPVRHAEQMNYLCDGLGLHQDAQRVAQIVDLRNELMHEALWDGGQPGTARSSVTLEAPPNLHRFNLRVFLALLGIRAGFVATPWHFGGTFVLDLKN